MRLLGAIKLAHRLRNKKLNVKHRGRYATWNACEDEGWQDYNRTRRLISRHKVIERVLVWLGLV